MSKIAVIGGSHFASLKNLVITHSTTVKTPFGEPSAPLSYGILGDQEVVYLPRRGNAVPLPAHEINYRANIWALRDAGVEKVIATAAVTGIVDNLRLGDLVIPDQLIDYTYRRDNTFLGEDSNVSHISFAHPYTETLRNTIIKKASKLNYSLHLTATYGITQGPRLETLAEIEKFVRDGCHLLGMTGMPEAALARELALEYACIALVVRKAVTCQREMVEAKQIQEKGSWVEHLIEEIILEAT